MCVADDCAQPVGNKGARGYCPKHYKRLRARGDVHFAYRAPLSVRFARYVQPGNPDSCWPWRGGHDQDGYGKVWDADVHRSVSAHRVAWEQVNGQIPPGLVVCHRCDNPPCVNPSHLFLGTVQDNNTDKLAKGRHRGNTTGQLGDRARRLSDAAVAEIRRRYTGTYGQQAQLGREFGVSGQHIRAIVLGERR